MSKDLNNVQKKVFSSEFSEFCREQFSRDMDALEEERKKALLYALLIAIVITIIFCCLFYFFLIPTNNENRNLVFVLNAFFLFFCYIPIYLYKKKVKNRLMPKLLAFIGKFEFDDSFCKKADISSRVKSLKLFGDYNDITIDDVIEGTYNDIDILISEMCLKYKYTTTRKKKGSIRQKAEYSEKIVFKGVLLSFKSFKNFKSRTVIKSEHTKLFSNSKQVNLEDPDFEKIYDVESEDQIEARYLVTPAFMNRVLEYSKSKSAGKITISFENGNVNIAVHSNKNWFDIPIFHSATDVSIYKNILLDLISILKIIDALKLEQNIGL